MTDITSTMDGLYWGVLISTMLFGITMSQGWTYARNNNDKWHLRLLVAVLILMDSGTTYLNGQIPRYYLMSNFGNYSNYPFPKTILVVLGLSTAAIYLSTLFFVSRLYILDKSCQWATAIATFFITGYFIIITMQAGSVHEPSVFFSICSSPSTKIQIGIGLAFLALSLTTITVVMHKKLSSGQTNFKMCFFSVVLQSCGNSF
ncbi:hypothetical protein L208DRAFT_1389476 [Tricholoma matsutake]|nr:hypothetical protein L208DRAFT_1389476 [Tricholoma matsutake 945]